MRRSSSSVGAREIVRGGQHARFRRFASRWSSPACRRRRGSPTQARSSAKRARSGSSPCARPPSARRALAVSGRMQAGPAPGGRRRAGDDAAPAAHRRSARRAPHAHARRGRRPVVAGSCRAPASASTGNVVEIVDPQQAAAGAADRESRAVSAAGAVHRKRRRRKFARRPDEAVRGVTGTRARAEALTRYVNATAAEEADRQPAVGARSAAHEDRRLQRAHGAVRRDGAGASAFPRALRWDWCSCAARSTTTRGRRCTSTKAAQPRLRGCRSIRRSTSFRPTRTHLRLARGGLDKQAAILPLIGRVKIDGARPGASRRARRRFSSAQAVSDAAPLAHACRSGGVALVPAVLPGRPRMIAIHDLRKAVRRVHRGRRRQPRRAAGRDSRISRAERRRQDDDDPDDCGPAEADVRPHRRQRPRSRDEPGGARRPRSGSFPIGRTSTRSSPPGSSCDFTPGCTASTAAASDQRVREMLDLFELGRWEHELVESFSHGMKQRLVMCAAFLHRPQAVLVDEPMVGLDPRGAKLIKSVFRRMSEHGVAILMSTHTLEVAQEMCDRISIILKGQDHRARHRGRAARRWPGASDERADAGVPEADRRQRPAGDRRDRMMMPFPLPAAAARTGRRATASGGGERGDFARGVAVRRRRRPRVRGAVLGRVLDYHAARCLRRARRFPAAHRPVVAVPHVPVVSRLQRRRDGAVDVLPVRGPAAAAGGADRDPPAVLRAVREDRAAVVVDGRHLSAAGAARRRHRAMRAVHVLRDGAADGRAVLRHSGRARDRDDAAAGERLSGATRARHPDADGAACSPAASCCCSASSSPSGCCASSRCRTSPDFFATLQSPITPMLPSFWAGETLFASLAGGRDLLHAGALWTTACAFTVMLSAASERWYFAGFSKSQEARKARFTKLRMLDRARARAAAVGRAPEPADQGPEGVPARRHPVVAAAAAARAGDGVSLQLPRARSGSHSVHGGHHQELLRVPEPRAWRGS